MIINLLRETKSLAEAGVTRGWFCRYGGCSIWFEVVDVFDDMLKCTGRSAREGTNLVIHSSRNGYRGVSEVCDSLAEVMRNGAVILSEPRAKNFVDKFNKEPEAVARFGQHPRVLKEAAGG